MAERTLALHRAVRFSAGRHGPGDRRVCTVLHGLGMLRPIAHRKGGMGIVYTTVTGPQDVVRILDLQALNHRDAVDTDTAAREGFTSVRHVPEVLQAMNRQWPSVVAWAGAELAGYCLMMPRSFSTQVPILQPMFALLDTLHWKGLALATDPRWFVMGQVCVASGWRGQGVFDGLYRHLREAYATDFDYTITEISQRNPRSLRAHRRVGFETLHRYPDPDTGEIWEVVGWDWRQPR